MSAVTETEPARWVPAPRLAALVTFGALTATPAPIPIEAEGLPVPVAEPSALTWLVVLFVVAIDKAPVAVTSTVSGTKAVAEEVTTPTPIAAATSTLPSVVEAERLSAVEALVCFVR